MDRWIIKITCIIPYTWIGIGAAKPSHKSKVKQEILRKKKSISVLNQMRIKKGIIYINTKPQRV